MKRFLPLQDAIRRGTAAKEWKILYRIVQGSATRLGFARSCDKHAGRNREKIRLCIPHGFRIRACQANEDFVRAVLSQISGDPFSKKVPNQGLAITPRKRLEPSEALSAPVSGKMSISFYHATHDNRVLLKLVTVAFQSSAPSQDARGENFPG